MGIKNELNKNKVKNAYGSVNNTSLLKSKNNISPQSVKVESMYKPNDYSKKETSSKTQTKTQGLTTLIKSFALVASAVILGETGISVLSPPTVQVEEMYVDAYETGVYYYVSLSDYTDDLTIVLKNDFTNRVDKIEEQSADGSFENLAPNMQYTFLIKQGSKIVAKQTVVTRPRVEEEYDQPDKPDEDDYNGRDPTNGDYYPTSDGEPGLEDYSGEDGSNEKPITNGGN